MKEDLVEPEIVRAIQEHLCGFLLDHVISKDGEFYCDPFVSIGVVDPQKTWKSLTRNETYSH